MRYAEYPLAALPSLRSQYPLQKRVIVWGLATTFFLGLLISLPFGLSFGVLIWLVGMLWRNGEPPILVFCFSYQWATITWGYLYYRVTDIYPGFDVPGDVDQAILLSLGSLLSLAAGFRVGFRALKAQFASASLKLQSSEVRYNVQRLFWAVIAFYTINWFIEIQPMEIVFDVAQFIYRVLEFRGVILVLLLLCVIHQQDGYRYGAFGLLYAIIPSFASIMSSFKDYLFLLFIVLLRDWRPWAASRQERMRSLRIAKIVIVLAVSLLVMGVVWEAGIKPIWRPAIVSGEIEGSPLAKITAFGSVGKNAVEGLTVRDSVEKFLGNLSSATGFFSLVLLTVPDHVDYENGGLILRALEHVVTPRFLFPEKPNLGGDSWLVRKYAGINVAGEESNTSVGLGYIAEFYIDFGAPLMFIEMFAYGIVLALAYQSLIFFCPSVVFYHSAVVIMFAQHFTTVGEIAKQLGGLAQTFLVFAIFMRFLGPWLHGKLLEKKKV